MRCSTLEPVGLTMLSGSALPRLRMRRLQSKVKDQVRHLAREYEAVRAAMESGRTRTQRMEAITNRMKSLSSVAYPLVGELATSASPGDRLAAIAMLEMIPSQEYIEWLASRFGAERPFIEYHSAVALLSAVRELPREFHPRLRLAIVEAMRRLGDYRSGDRVWILKNALAELDELEDRSDSDSDTPG